MIKIQIEGIDEINRAFTKLGKVPQKCITPAVKKGMTIPQKEAKLRAPYESGMLEQGIILAGERAKLKGKKVYEIVFDRNMNDVFQKFNAAGKQTGYYPASQEYGFFTVSGNYIPGFRFVRASMEDKFGQMERTVIGTMRSKMRAELVKAGIR